MLKKIINIVLVFSLLIGVVGISSAKTYCNELQMIMNDGCCSDNPSEIESCCKPVVTYEKVSTDLQSVDHAIKLPPLQFLGLTILDPLYEAPVVVLNNKHNEKLYVPPLSTRDIPVFVQNFRI